MLPAASAWALTLAGLLRPWVATVCVAERVGASVFVLDSLVAPTDAFVPASTGLLQGRKSSVLQGFTHRGVQLLFAWPSSSQLSFHSHPLVSWC